MLRQFVKCFRSSCLNNCDDPLSDRLVDYSCMEQWSASPYDMPLLPADETVPRDVTPESPLALAPAELRRQVPFVPSMPFGFNDRIASRKPSTKISHCARTPEASIAWKSSENGTSDFSTTATRRRDRKGSRPGERDTRKYNTSTQGPTTSAPVAAVEDESAMALSDEQNAKRRTTTNVVFRRRRVNRKKILPCTPFHLSKEYEAWYKKHIGKCTKRHMKEYKNRETIQLMQQYDLHTIREDDECETDEDEKMHFFIKKLFTSEGGLDDF